MTTAIAQYEIKGITGDITTCEHCGRTNLKRTVILATLDADGNTEGEPIHFGTACAATAMRKTNTWITNTANAAQSERDAEVAWATSFVDTYGPVEGDVRATAALFFDRNPHARGTCKASEWVGTHLAKARAILAA